jgi:(p)ppGpp synthase/HD superfamily hydrolase
MSMPEGLSCSVLTSRFQRAFLLACELHAGRVRRGTRIPYPAHLPSVAALVLEHGSGENAAAAGLLHDAVEDAADGVAAAARIREELGGHVAGIVLGCSDAVAVPGQPKQPRRARKSAYLDRLAARRPSARSASSCDGRRSHRTGPRAGAPGTQSGPHGDRPGPGDFAATP